MLAAAWAISAVISVAGNEDSPKDTTSFFFSSQIRRKAAMLLIQSALCLIWLKQAALVLIGVALGNLALLQIRSNGEASKRDRLIKWSCILLTLSPLLALKGMPILNWTTLLLNFALSFFCLQQLGAVLDRFNPFLSSKRASGHEVRTKSDSLFESDDLLDWLNFSIFFPTLLIGPILRWGEFQDRYANPASWRWSNALHAVAYAVQAIFRRGVLAAPFGAWGVGLLKNASELGFLGWSFAAITLRWSLYHDFGAQVDLSRAVAAHLGFELPVNFRQPFAARSILDFWRRWHVSLSSWIRDFVYLPILYGPMRCLPSRLSVTLAAMIAFALFGLWHQFSWAMILMGSWEAFGVLFESQFRSNGHGRLSKLVGLTANAFLLLLFVFWPTLLFHVSPNDFFNSLVSLTDWRLGEDLAMISAAAPWRWEAYVLISMVWFAAGEWKESNFEVGFMLWKTYTRRPLFVLLIALFMIASVFVWAQFPQSISLPYLSM